MKILFLSDTHSKGLSKIFDGLYIDDVDVLVHCGDFSNMGKLHEMINFNKWLGKLPFKHKIFIAGNHDLCMEKDPNWAKSIITNATYLQDEELIIDGVKFYGTPWCVSFGSWAFGLPGNSEAMEKKRAMIPDDVEILITHTPPYQIMDVNFLGEHCGCVKLRHRVNELKKLKYHCYGHLHEGYSPIPFGKFINCSVCNEKYEAVNSPVIVEI